MILKLAWRNLWRNKRRTFITIASIFFAVILSTLMMSVKDGVYTKMIDSMVGSFTGYAQIHKKGYWEEKKIDNSLHSVEALNHYLSNYNEVIDYSPRIESFGLIASESKTKGALVIGVDIEKEKKWNLLHEQIADGVYFENEQHVVLGKGLADNLDVDVGDSIIILGQGYHGVSAAGKYKIDGLVRFGSPELSKQSLFLPLQSAQHLFGLESGLTTVILHFNKPNKLDDILNKMHLSLPIEYELMSWKALNPDVVKMIETDKVEGYVFMFILYMVISFGIFSTILMMLMERKREFGMMIALGMGRLKLASVVYLEVVVISLIGAFFGTIGALPICSYFYFFPIKLSDDLAKMSEDYGLEPIIQASLSIDVFLQQAMVMLLLGVILGLFPLLKIIQMKAINEMRR